jgi:release factor glutamine methyltransferase
MRSDDPAIAPGRTPTASDLISLAAARLAAVGVDSPRLDAEVLLRHVLGIDRARLFAALRDPVPAGAIAEFDALIQRRLSGVSVAYLIGAKEFMGLPFAVGPGVLVPRPETELLVEWAEQRLPRDEQAIIVDVGTGSGAIILAIASRAGLTAPGRLVGCDMSRDALGYAIRNRAALGLRQRVSFVHGNLLTWLGRPAHLILANLPYLRPDQVAANPELAPEPGLALVSGDDGLDEIRRLTADLPRVLAPGGSAIFEVDPTQAGTVGDLVVRKLPDARVAILPDLTGRNRFVTAERAVNAASGQRGTIPPVGNDDD